MENATTVLGLRDFKITEYPDQLGTDFKHFSAHLPNSSLGGFGSSQDPKLALKKAIGECIERLHFQVYAKDLGVNTTSGFAVHVSEELAREAAICEALERDAVLTHWLLKKRPVWLNQEELSGEIQLEIAKFQAHSFEIKIGTLCLTNDRFCMVGCLLGNRLDRGVFSAACHQKRDQAILSILQELRRAATVVKNRLETGFKTTSQGASKKAAYHFDYYLEPDNFKQISWFFEEKEKEAPTYNLKIEAQNLPLTHKTQWPIYLAHANSSQIQSFYFGEPRWQKINRKRLSPLFSKGDKLNSQLHILP